MNILHPKTFKNQHQETPKSCSAQGIQGCFRSASLRCSPASALDSCWWERRHASSHREGEESSRRSKKLLGGLLRVTHPDASGEGTPIVMEVPKNPPDGLYGKILSMDDDWGVALFQETTMSGRGTRGLPDFHLDKAMGSTWCSPQPTEVQINPWQSVVKPSNLLSFQCLDLSATTNPRSRQHQKRDVEP